MFDKKINLFLPGELINYSFCNSFSEINNKNKNNIILVNENTFSNIELLKASNDLGYKIVVKINETTPLYYRNTMIYGLLIDDVNLKEKYLNEINSMVLDLSKYDLFLVDFDGTIVDTMRMWYSICPDFLEYKGVKTNDDVLSLIKSLTNLEIAKLMHERYFTDLTLEDVTEQFFDFIRQQYLKQNIKSRGIELLKELNKHGNVILYSATAKSLLCVLLDLFDLYQYFSNVCSGSDLKLTKRDGTGYLEIMKMTGNYHNVLVLEDAPHAIIGASSQNLDVLALSDFSNHNSYDVILKDAKYFINIE